MERILIIVRGIPGSGKTTFANILSRAVCSADDYFMRDGKYQWSVDRVGTAHLWCQRKCKRFMMANVERIVIANTNTTPKEMKAYFELAAEYNYKVFSVIVENRHGNRSVHGVPDVTLDKMRERFDVKL